MRGCNYYRRLVMPVMLAILIVLIAGCQSEDNGDSSDPALPQEDSVTVDDSDAGEDEDARQPATWFVQELIEQQLLPPLEVGMKSSAHSDTVLWREPAFDAEKLEYLQHVELEILGFQDSFAQVRTVNFTVNKEGWVSLLALMPTSEHIAFYRGNPLKLTADEASLLPLPMQMDGGEFGQELPRLTLNHPVQVQRVFGDYVEVRVLGEEGQLYSQVWLHKDSLKPYDPDLVIQGQLHANTQVKLAEGGMYRTEAAQLVWRISERDDERLVIRMPDGRTGEISTEDFVSDPFTNETDPYWSEQAETFVWQEHYPPEAAEEGDRVHVVHISSNQPLIRQSVVDAVKNSLATSAISAEYRKQSQLSFTYKWVSNRSLYIYIEGLREYESAYFDLGSAVTASHHLLSEAVDRPELLAVVVASQSAGRKSIHATQAAKLATNSINLPAFVDYRMIELQDGQRRMLLYGDSYTLLHPKTLKSDSVPTLAVTAELLQDRTEGSYFNEMAADRWGKDEVYVVVGTHELYKYQYNDGTGELLYRSEHPIYGLAISPDHSRVALLVSSEQIPVSAADLLVLDKRGQVIFTHEQAAVIPHSDGIWSIYPIYWFDADTITVETYIDADPYPEGAAYRHIHVQSGEVSDSELPHAFLKEGESLLRLNDGRDIPIDARWGRLMILQELPARYYLSPNGKHIMLAVNGQLFLHDAARSTTEWLGTGSFAEWTDHDAFLWLQGHQPYIYF